MWITTHNFQPYGFRLLPQRATCFLFLWWCSQLDLGHITVLSKDTPRKELVRELGAYKYSMLFGWVLQTVGFFPLSLGGNTSFCLSTFLGDVPDTHRHKVVLYFLSEQKQHHWLSDPRPTYTLLWSHLEWGCSLNLHKVFLVGLLGWFITALVWLL